MNDADGSEFSLEDIAEAAHAASDSATSGDAEIAAMAGVDEEKMRAELAAELADVEGQLARGEITEDADAPEARNVYQYVCKRRKHKQRGAGGVQLVDRETKEIIFTVKSMCLQCKYEAEARMYPTRKTDIVLSGPDAPKKEGEQQ